jgi:hypothetical protein
LAIIGREEIEDLQEGEKKEGWTIQRNAELGKSFSLQQSYAPLPIFFYYSMPC